MNKYIKELIVPIYYFLWRSYIKLRNIGIKSRYQNAFEIPIIINNRNRLTFMKELIDRLENMGYKNIYIIDNNSTYKPLLDYYKQTPHTVFRLKENLGFLSLWKSGIYKNFQKDYFVYTDSDVVPVENCPANFLQIFLEEMKKDNNLMKVGLSLKIDDLPDYFAQKYEVIKWESQYFTNKVNNHFYLANVDTTFALYRPFMSGGASRHKMYRSAAPMEAYHMPWYNDTSNLSEEEVYYIQNAKTSTHWTSK